MCGGEEFTLTIECTGTAPWTVVYTDGTNEYNVTMESSPQTFTHTVEGNYSLISIVDANGVEGTVEGTLVTRFYEPATGSISGGGQICKEGTVEVELLFTGTGPWSYSYQVGKDIISGVSEEPTLIIDAGSEGEYSLISVSDANCGGEVSGLAQVTKYDLPTGNVYLDPNYCVGDEISLNNNVTEEGMTFSWTTTGSGNLKNADSKIAQYTAVEPENNITFTLTANNGCSNTVFTASASFINVSAEFTIDPTPGENGILANVPYNYIASDLGAANYEWDFGDGSGSSFSTATHEFGSPGDYSVTLNVARGECSDSKSLQVTIADNDNLYIPNVISPGSSNPENNSIKVYGEDLSSDEFEFFIYNRWGQVVYKTTSLNDAQGSGWNGTTGDDEKGNNVFTYTVRGKFNNGERFEETGTITLVK